MIFTRFKCNFDFPVRLTFQHAFCGSCRRGLNRCFFLMWKQILVLVFEDPMIFGGIQSQYWFGVWLAFHWLYLPATCTWTARNATAQITEKTILSFSGEERIIATHIFEGHLWSSFWNCVIQVGTIKKHCVDNGRDNSLGYFFSRNRQAYFLTWRFAKSIFVASLFGMFVWHFDGGCLPRTARTGCALLRTASPARTAHTAPWRPGCSCPRDTARSGRGGCVRPRTDSRAQTCCRCRPYRRSPGSPCTLRPSSGSSRLCTYPRRTGRRVRLPWHTRRRFNSTFRTRYFGNLFVWHVWLAFWLVQYFDFTELAFISSSLLDFRHYIKHTEQGCT